MGCALIPRLRAKLREYWPLPAALLTLSWPVMLENAMQTLVQYVDTAMVGVLGAQGLRRRGTDRLGHVAGQRRVLRRRHRRSGGHLPRAGR